MNNSTLYLVPVIIAVSTAVAACGRPDERSEYTALAASASPILAELRELEHQTFDPSEGGGLFSARTKMLTGCRRLGTPAAKLEALKVADLSKKGIPNGWVRLLKQDGSMGMNVQYTCADHVSISTTVFGDDPNAYVNAVNDCLKSCADWWHGLDVELRDIRPMAERYGVAFPVLDPLPGPDAGSNSEPVGPRPLDRSSLAPGR